MLITQDQDKWTYQRMVAELPAESRFELRNFNLLSMASPFTLHQNILLKIVLLLSDLNSKKNKGHIFVSPLDVIFDEGNICQPDIIFVLNENKSIIQEKNIVGTPDLLVEIVSKGSISRDYLEKKNDYEKFGVKEYWIVDSMNQSIWVYSLNEEGKYELHSHAESEQTATSKLLEGFSLNHQIFESGS